jgi:predicted DNA binding protein
VARTVEDQEADSVVEVEFRVTDRQYPLVRIPDQFGCHTEVEQFVPRGGDTYGVFHRISGASVRRVAEHVNDRPGIEARVVSETPDGGITEVVVTDSDEHFIVTLTDAGAIPREVRSEDGVAHIVAEVPAMYCPSKVIDCFLSVHPTVEVVARRQKDHAVPMFTRREFQRALDDLLTPRQREALRVAYVCGYFDWPRAKSGEEVADELGVSHPTFSQHLRTAERKVFSLLFSEY